MIKYIPVFLVCMILGGSMAQAAETNSKIYDFPVTTIEGKETTLAAYRGKTLLIVNVASRCGFTDQYKDLQALYEKYKDKGLVVLGFPANNFMFQEPGSNEEIKKFCSLKYNVTFPMFSKISVKGGKQHPLYRYLTEETQSKVSWNFNKYLVAPEGKVLKHFGSKTEPLSKEMIEAVEAALPQA